MGKCYPRDEEVPSWVDCVTRSFPTSRSIPMDGSIAPPTYYTRALALHSTDSTDTGRAQAASSGKSGAAPAAPARKGVWLISIDSVRVVGSDRCR